MLLPSTTRLCGSDHRILTARLCQGIVKRWFKRTNFCMLYDSTVTHGTVTWETIYLCHWDTYSEIWADSLTTASTMLLPSTTLSKDLLCSFSRVIGIHSLQCGWTALRLPPHCYYLQRLLQGFLPFLHALRLDFVISRKTMILRLDHVFPGKIVAFCAFCICVKSPFSSDFITFYRLQGNPPQPWPCCTEALHKVHIAED